MKALIEVLEENNISTEDMDDLVTDASSQMASNANNEGLRGQVAFLNIVAGWSDSQILEYFHISS